MMKMTMNKMTKKEQDRIRKKRFKNDKKINSIIKSLSVKGTIIRCMMLDIVFTNGADIEIPNVSLGIDMFVDLQNLNVYYNGIKDTVNQKLSKYKRGIKTKAYSADTIFQILLIEERRIYRINVLNKIFTPDKTGLQASRREVVQECIEDFQMGNPHTFKTVEQVERRLDELYKTIYDIMYMVRNTENHYGMKTNTLEVVAIYCIFKYFKKETGLYEIIDEQIWHWLFIETLLVNPDEK